MPLPRCFDSQSDHDVMTAKTIRVFTPLLLLVFVAVNAVTIGHSLVVSAIADLLVVSAISVAIAIAILAVLVVFRVTVVAVVAVLMTVAESGTAACT